MIFLKTEIRVELSLQRSEADQNKWLFDKLQARREEIEDAFGQKIKWLRLNEKKASRLQFGQLVDGYDRDSWSDYVNWHVEMIQKWEAALRKPLAEIAKEFRSVGGAL